MEITIQRDEVTEPESGVTCHIAVHLAGKRTNSPILCVHGLTRNAKDFYPLARALAADHHVMMVDVPGRGESDNLPFPALYNNAFYAAVICQWLQMQGHQQCTWIGTSMGGLIGMIVAATKGDLIQNMLLNDIGHIIPAAALEHIKSYVGVNTEHEDVAVLARQVEDNLCPFGIQDPEILAAFVAASIKKKDHHGFRLNYDPVIRDAFLEIPDEDADISDIWKLVQCPVLLFRGESSELLPRPVAEAMVASKEQVELFEVVGAGHAPSLTTLAEIERITAWLRGCD